MTAISRTQLRASVASALAAILGRGDPIDLTDETRASDVPGWDSLAHLKLLVALEETHDISFGAFDLENPNNFGEFLSLIEAKIEASGA
jgi:acyl carrier protein